jgi:phage shock protein PspC (stress-responsive transcriptional regulator)
MLYFRMRDHTRTPKTRITKLPFTKNHFTRVNTGASASITGVCDGLGGFFGINPFWFQLAMFIAFIPGGVPGILIYIIAMIVIPAE